MDTFKSFNREIYTQNDESFARIALELFRFQAEENPLYRQFLNNLKIDVPAVNAVRDIPFLPISFFKSHTVKSGNWTPETYFESSGTTGSVPSRHAVFNQDHYLEHARHCFEEFFGPVENYHFFALLPSYLERNGSSLISMMQYFITESGSDESGFFLNEYDDLLESIIALRSSEKKIILWGVSFALLDFCERFNVDLSHCYLFETGGMKGRRREITREELHQTLKKRLGDPPVFSEYGMTELFSQAYTTGGLRFRCPSSMRVIGRDPSDPFTKGLVDETCALNVIDLANWSTISFIETEDQGKVFADGTFAVTGRMDNSEIRGCNLMVS